MNEAILVIDDNEEILEFVSDVLSDAYTVYTAATGEIALSILDNHLINLVITDIMMPDMDGFKLCTTIKSAVDYCHIPVVLLTAQNTYNSQIAGLEVGADAYIRKPFSPEYLLLQVANLLRNRSKVREHFASAPFEDIRLVAYSKTDELFLKKLGGYIEENIGDINLDIEQLADVMNMSRPTFYRKIKSLSALTPKELINATRLKKAAELISQNEYKLYEIAHMTGYSSQSIFGKNFQKHFGMPPIEYLSALKKAAG